MLDKMHSVYEERLKTLQKEIDAARKSILDLQDLQEYYTEKILHIEELGGGN